MKFGVYILFIVSFSCQSNQSNTNRDEEKEKPLVLLNKKDFSISTKPDSFYLNVVQFTIQNNGKSLVFDLLSQKKNTLQLYDSLKAKLPNISFEELDTLNYNLKIEIQSAHFYGYNLEYGYIHPKMNTGQLQSLKPLVK